MRRSAESDKQVTAMTVGELKRELGAGALDGALAALYSDLPAARCRAISAAEEWQQIFGRGEESPVFLVSAPGRTELGGNHTDHQRGRVLCAAVDLDALACAGPNGRAEIRAYSRGYGMACVDLARLEPTADERGTSQALIRGVAAGMAEHGCPVKGLDLYVDSQVPAGSGLSSSAAYEILLGTAMNALFGGGLDSVTLAKIGQRAENAFFGKPCGLLDQTACAVGGAAAVDFADPAQPAVEPLDFDFSACGYDLCIVDTDSTHADLTDAYAAIPAEMGAVAACFGKTALREVDEEDFLAALPALRKAAGDRAVLRAMHFFEENRRAGEQAEALKRGDFRAFLSLVNESGRSSWCKLQNISAGDPRQQAVALSLARGQQLLAGEGTIRVHGGGFAGTVQAFVPHEQLERFRTGMEALLGAGACRVLRIRPRGGCVIVGKEGINHAG